MFPIPSQWGCKSIFVNLCMNEKPNIEQARPVPKGRLIIGSVVLIGGFFSPLLISLVLASGWNAAVKTTLSGLLAFGIPEIAMILAIAIMGKAGLDFLKSKFKDFLLKYGPPDQVSPARYKIGLTMFILPFLVGFALPYIQSYSAFLLRNVIPISIILDIVLISSLFVLGGNFWDKLYGLFSYNAKLIKK